MSYRGTNPQVMGMSSAESATFVERGRLFRRCLAIASCLVLGILPSTVSGATFVIGIVSADDPEADQITVAPGDRIAYTVIGEVFSDDDTTPDNEGLAGLVFDILTDFGVEQPPADEIDAAVTAVLNADSSTGTSNNDDILILGAAYSNPESTTTGLAVGDTQVIARGELITPQTEGTFSVTIGPNLVATVLVRRDDGSLTVSDATVETEIGLTIITDASVDAAGDTTSTTDDTSDTADGTGSDDVFPLSTDDMTLVGVAAAALSLVGVIAFGPLGLLVGLISGLLGTLAWLMGYF